MAQDKENAPTPSSASKKDTVVRIIKDQAGKALDGAAEVAAVAGLGKVAEAFGKVEVASDEQLTATEKGYFEAMGKLAENADTREERDAIRDNLNQAHQTSHNNAKEKSKERIKVFGQIAAAMLVVIGVVTTGAKMIGRR